MVTAKTRKYISLLLAFAVVFGIVFPAMPNIVHAKESSFAESDVLDDLLSSTANGAAFDITDFPYNEYGSVQLLQLVEYCYSYRANMQQDYALYLYVYNPTGKAIDTKSAANTVQMAAQYNSSGEPVRYEKFPLECVSVSDGAYQNLFYKFRVVDKKVNGTTFADRVNTNERRYDISGMELLTTGNINATEYHVGGTYMFTGFAAGCGADTEAGSTLACTSQNLETLSLEVKHTNYRTGVSSLGKYHYNEVHTVYFSVPERVFEAYGNLQKIHAQWWEYKTKMAAITSSKEFYDALLPYVGTDVGEYDASVPVRLYCDYTGSGSSPVTHNYGWTYNVDLSRKYNVFGGVTEICYADRISTIMPYAFYTAGKTADSVDAETVRAWIYSYSNSLGNGYIDCNGRKISVDLFESYVDEGRKLGYNNVNIDLEDTFDLGSYDSNHSWWDKLLDYGFSWPTTDEGYENISPIYALTAQDLTGTDAYIAKRLLVNEQDVSDIKAYYAAETAKGNKVFLFRFANTDYYTAPAFRSGYSGSILDTDTYVAQQTVFLDFDIIDLTFQKDGVYRVIPVVSDPVDIVNDFTPPPEEENIFMKLLGILLTVLLLVALLPVLKYVVQGIVWLFGVIVKGIQKIRRKE